MKSIKVSEKAHSGLVAQAAYLTIERGKKATLSDALEFLLQKMEAD